jgi:quercetin dioxygenase-like cupin family protein
MHIERLENFTRGWVTGDFEPSLIKTGEFEFAIQYFHKGDKHEKHYHKVAREITVVVYGEFLLNGHSLKAGDVVLIEPNDFAEFQCLKDGATAVVKTPSVKNDKYLAN